MMKLLSSARRSDYAGENTSKSTTCLTFSIHVLVEHIANIYKSIKTINVLVPKQWQPHSGILYVFSG